MPTEQERWERALGLSGMRPVRTTSQVEDPRERERIAQKELWESAGGKTPGDIGEQRRLKAAGYREGAKARWAKALGVDRTDPSQQRQPMRVHTRESVTEAREQAATTAFARQKELITLGAGLQETAADKAAKRKTEAETVKYGRGKEVRKDVQRYETGVREDVQEWQAGQNEATRDATKSISTLRHNLSIKQLAETVRYHDALVKSHEQDLAQAMQIAEAARADRQRGMAADNSVAMLKSWQSQYVMLGQRLKAFEYDLASEKVEEDRKKEIKETIKKIGTAIGVVLRGMKTERARLTKLAEGVEAPKKLDEEGAAGPTTQPATRPSKNFKAAMKSVRKTGSAPYNASEFTPEQQEQLKEAIQKYRGKGSRVAETRTTGAAVPEKTPLEVTRAYEKEVYVLTGAEYNAVQDIPEVAQARKVWMDFDGTTDWREATRLEIAYKRIALKHARQNKKRTKS